MYYIQPTSQTFSLMGFFGASVGVLHFAFGRLNGYKPAGRTSGSSFPIKYSASLNKIMFNTQQLGGSTVGIPIIVVCSCDFIVGGRDSYDADDYVDVTL